MISALLRKTEEMSRIVLRPGYISNYWAHWSWLSSLLMVLSLYLNCVGSHLGKVTHYVALLDPAMVMQAESGVPPLASRAIAQVDLPHLHLDIRMPCRPRALVPATHQPWYLCLPSAQGSSAAKNCHPFSSRCPSLSHSLYSVMKPIMLQELKVTTIDCASVCWYAANKELLRPIGKSTRMSRGRSS